MADTYEQNLSQKGTLTVSDYIRVVGSDNASYKQLVSDVADKVLTLGKSASTVGTISDLDAITPFTTGYATFTASVSPTGAQGAYWYSLIGWGTGARTEITCIDVSGTVYTRVKDYSGWKAWVKQPTRAEVATLSTTRTATINTSASISGVCTYIQAGKMVTVSGTISIPSGTASTVELVTGLPNCLVSNAGFVANNNNTTSGYIDMFITANGALRLKEASTSTVSARFTFSYVAS